MPTSPAAYKGALQMCLHLKKGILCRAPRHYCKFKGPRVLGGALTSTNFCLIKATTRFGWIMIFVCSIFWVSNRIAHALIVGISRYLMGIGITMTINKNVVFQFYEFFINSHINLPTNDIITYHCSCLNFPINQT